MRWLQVGVKPVVGFNRGENSPHWKVRLEQDLEEVREVAKGLSRRRAFREGSRIECLRQEPAWPLDIPILTNDLPWNWDAPVLLLVTSVKPQARGPSLLLPPHTHIPETPHSCGFCNLHTLNSSYSP